MCVRCIWYTYTVLIRVMVVVCLSGCMFAESMVPEREKIQRNLKLSSVIHSTIDRAAYSYSLDPDLVRVVIQVESSFNPYAVSSKGARGLMQIMPDTAKELGIKNIFNIEENIFGGCKYLRRLLNNYNGDLQLALAAYNAGPTVVNEHGGIPPYRETRNYVRKILSRYKGGRYVSKLRAYRDQNNRLVISNVPRGRR